MKYLQSKLLILVGVLLGLTEVQAQQLPSSSKRTHQDVPFVQEYSIKYYSDEQSSGLEKVYADRNGTVQILGSKGLYRTHAGAFLYPGSFTPDKTYLAMKDKNVVSIATVEDQFVYLDDKAVFSNAWAGSLYLKHELPGAVHFAHGEDFTFLVSDGSNIHLVNQEGVVYKGKISGSPVIGISYDMATGRYLLLAENKVMAFSAASKKLQTLTEGSGFTSFVVREGKNKLAVATTDGYFEWDLLADKKVGAKNNALPWPSLTSLTEINGLLWFGSERGAFMQKEDGGFNYYYGERWLPGDKVLHISQKNEDEVLVLTDKGLGKLVFMSQTLAEKAAYYGEQVRERHIRHGFNSTLTSMEKGNMDTGRLADSDNDGLWTSMYLGGEAFRYAATGSADALQNVKESLDALERLYTINPVKGFPSRSFFRSGYIEKLADPDRWQHASDKEWDWKATTSSDEVIGHVFVFAVIAELVDNEALRKQAIGLLDQLMTHIVENDWYLIDYDGKHTTWGRWNPEYVNGFPTMVGDRKLNSSNIIAMLQTAYHFTGKEVYKKEAYMLMEKHGYLENLMRPMEVIGKAQEGSDDWAAMLSESWNHSDDEMYFMGYWGLYRYAFTDELKEKYRLAIQDHWESERPEKDGLWNIFGALVDRENFDLEEAVWYLQEHPLDMISWNTANSHRKDIKLLEQNFREQTTDVVLPPDELMIRRHNGNRFTLDGGNGGGQEYSAGDIWLLPYWMGRYLGVISDPLTK
ncbi:hypothetical protein [Cyclobacterium qasimii]|uniref:Uncharacterized protein n=2 Tax=Cyclobacterium qasimii TaxID=1350429 RepID=S7V8J8_9BACT|nr:hypothetical protein [Cyclobacterium qasimii]EPR65892.1 hypothetical protein ADICYQ_5037 [Cyclobacterium qasimii M12-11B]GEO23198.1 hypothetical protein CQA01_37320 [Cyclobacterium qasimii]